MEAMGSPEDFNKGLIASAVAEEIRNVLNHL
jgi:hypothetical protein